MNKNSQSLSLSMVVGQCAFFVHISNYWSLNIPQNWFVINYVNKSKTAKMKKQFTEYYYPFLYFTLATCSKKSLKVLTLSGQLLLSISGKIHCCKYNALHLSLPLQPYMKIFSFLLWPWRSQYEITSRFSINLPRRKKTSY